MEEEMKQVNVKLPLDLAAMLDKMIKEDDSDQSKFIRKLIRQEYTRRHPPEQLSFPTPTKKNEERAEPVAA